MSMMKDDKPWWIKQRRFVVPSSLKAKISDLPEQSQINYCYIVNKVVIVSKKRPKFYHSISRDYFKLKIGSGYKRYIDDLKTWRILDRNDSYQAAGGKGFSKSCRLHPDVVGQPMVRMQFKKKVVQPLKDKSDLSSDVLKFIHDNLRRVGVKKELEKQDDLIDEIDAEQSAELVYFKKFDLHYSKVAERLFHTVIEMSKVARKNLVFTDDPSTPLFEYDVKSCHPVLLMTLMEDESERREYSKLLDGDIYETVAKARGVTDDRETLKEKFLMFASGVKNFYYDYFNQRFPILTEKIMTTPRKNGIAWYGQRVESEIMTKEVPKLLLEQCTSPSSTLLTCGGDSRHFYIPMHDGWLGLERDESVIAGVVRKVFAEATNGYQVTITRTSLIDRTKKIRLP